MFCITLLLRLEMEPGQDFWPVTLTDPVRSLNDTKYGNVVISRGQSDRLRPIPVSGIGYWLIAPISAGYWYHRYLPRFQPDTTNSFLLFFRRLISAVAWPIVTKLWHMVDDGDPDLRNAVRHFGPFLLKFSSPKHIKFRRRGGKRKWGGEWEGRKGKERGRGEMGGRVLLPTFLDLLALKLIEMLFSLHYLLIHTTLHVNLRHHFRCHI